MQQGKKPSRSLVAALAQPWSDPIQSASSIPDPGPGPGSVRHPADAIPWASRMPKEAGDQRCSLRRQDKGSSHRSPGAGPTTSSLVLGPTKPPLTYLLTVQVRPACGLRVIPKLNGSRRNHSTTIFYKPRLTWNCSGAPPPARHRKRARHTH